MENQKSPIEFNKLKEKANEFYCEGKYYDASSYYYGFIAYADKEYDTAFAAFKIFWVER